MPVGHVDAMLTPGAARATVLTPKLEKGASAPCWSDAATHTACGAPHGSWNVEVDASLSVDSLPAAVTKRMPLLHAFAIASSRNWSLPTPPHDALMTRMFTPLC